MGSWYSAVQQQQSTPKRGPGKHHAISGAVSNGGLIRITATAHTFSTSNAVDITGVVGTIEANKTGWVITVIDANTFDLQSSVFTNAYVSGGQASLQ